ncbi:MAG: lytic transglycosylase domain-containing protein [Candidatus Eremiobacteraeota bacterium]|nr:lytic transglycosylase domain-containing protein [Candidatus Eremiobacteraeota bacterium]MBV8499114.1 lytic transglycosylase domain-containing protein [Candidatus Eremiobacteraeota bacterium]
MKIAEELAAIERRIEAIAGVAGESGDFATALGAASRRKDAHAADAASRASIERMIGANAAEFGVDPALIEAVVQNESGFSASATSAAGARGLMQLMPGTARSLGVTNSYDPAQNVRGGTRYLRGLIDRFHEVELAVAAYNAGPGAVARFRGVPPYAETQNYVRDVLTRYRALRSHG